MSYNYGQTGGQPAPTYPAGASYPAQGTGAAGVQQTYYGQGSARRPTSHTMADTLEPQSTYPAYPQNPQYPQPATTTGYPAQSQPATGYTAQAYQYAQYTQNPQYAQNTQGGQYTQQYPQNTNQGGQ